MLGDFSKQADAYERSRPPYPTSLIEQLLKDANLQNDDWVVEIGAGTGVFTRQLIQHGVSLMVVEPSDDMWALANLPHVTRDPGTFESNQLADHGFKWAVAAQAFHWADPPIALPRLKRSLERGGIFTVLWNNRLNQQCELLQWTESLIRDLVPEFDEAYRNREWLDVLTSTGDFRAFATYSVDHIVEMNRERYLDLWRSHNRLNNIGGPQRMSEFFDKLVAKLDREQVNSIELPYRCDAWSVVVADAA